MHGFAPIRVFTYRKPKYGKDIDLFGNGLGGVLWSAEDVCKYLEIENSEKAIEELDPDVKDETLVLPAKDSQHQKLPRKVIIIDYRGLFSLLFHSQTPLAKRFQSFANEHVFFDIFLHGSGEWNTDDFKEREDEYKSVLEDLKVELGVWG